MSESNGIKAYVDRGFTEDESIALALWVQEGKPGLAKTKAEHLGSLYLLGYSCQEINQKFPEYPLPMLLHARWVYKWDELRNRETKEIEDTQKRTLELAQKTKVDSVQFLSEMLLATHARWRAEICEYLAAPDRIKPPKCLPDSIYSYQTVMAILKDVTEVKTPNNNQIGDLGGSPLVSVNISSNNEKPAIEVNQDLIQKSLQSKADEIRKKKK